MKKAFIQLHIAVLLAGLTGILGKLIHLNEGLLVWYRLLLTAPTLWLLALLRKQAIRIGWKEIGRIFGVGAIAAIHWVTFYGSIKYANVSVSLLCFSSIGFFTALIEPLLFRHKIDLVELLLGALVIVGIFFIFQVDPHYKVGIIIGLISALLGSLFPVLNKRILERVPAETVTLYELTGGFLFLTALMPLYLHLFPAPSLLPGWEDWIWLLILSWACTVLAFNLSMRALQKVSAFTVNLSYNLEPVYGILLAFLIFREDKYFNRGFYIGMFLIVLSIVLQTVRLRRRLLMKRAQAAVAVGLVIAAGLSCRSGSAVAQMTPLPGSAAARKDTVGTDPFKAYARLFGVPHHYICYTSADSMVIDGRAEEPAWKKAAWTEDFSDIEGDIRARPILRTRAKMLWDKNFLYIYAELQEPALQGVLLQHDTIIFQDNDFEVFLNPDDNTHNYFEIETNALGTIMDLFMFRPYRDGGKALMSWDVQGMRSAVHRKGTINHPSDTDEGWSVEMAIPLASIRFFGERAPRDSTIWRINFSRVEWDWDVADGRYVKRMDSTGRRLPEHNWVWSPQGIVDMHAPERWGWLQFSTWHAGGDTVGFRTPVDADARDFCWLIYYKQRDYYRMHSEYARTLQDLGYVTTNDKMIFAGNIGRHPNAIPERMTAVDAKGASYVITMKGASTQYLVTVESNVIKGVVTIDQDGMIESRTGAR